MSAPNFATANAGKIFAFGMNKYITKEAISANDWPSEWEGDFDEIQTQSDYQNSRDNCQNDLTGKGWEVCDEWDGDRSYCGHYFAEKANTFTVAGVECEVTVKVKTVSAYYDGNNFDWDAQLKIYTRDPYCGYYNTSEYDLTGNYAVCAADVIAENWCENSGFSKIQAKNIIKRIYKEMAILTTEAEKAFETWSDHRLACVARFSNGEAMY